MIHSGHTGRPPTNKQNTVYQITKRDSSAVLSDPIGSNKVIRCLEMTYPADSENTEDIAVKKKLVNQGVKRDSSAVLPDRDDEKDNSFELREVSMYSSPKNVTTNNLMLKVKINGTEVDAIIDTAAQVTLLNESFAKKLDPPVNLTNPVILKGAGENNSIPASYAEHTQIKVGKTETRWRVIVAKINDQVILGLDLLKHLKANINLDDFTITVKGEVLPIVKIQSNTTENITVYRIKLDEPVTVPSHTTVRIPVKFPATFDREFAVQPIKNLKGLLMPNIIVKANSQIPIILNNVTDKDVFLKKNHAIGTAMQVAEVLTDRDTFENATVRRIQQEVDSEHLQQQWEKIYSTYPAHLKTLLDSSTKKLELPEKLKVALTLLEFQDTFAKHDLDIGHFDKFKHRIDTGDAVPIKERMRRTPLGFEKEEEKHIQDLLEKGVIQPSTSEWAAAPVLVRKKDGKIRYCIDYRKLNAVTRKDAFPLPRIECCIDTLRGNKLMSCLDMASGYYQSEIHENDRHKTAFTTKYGLFEHVRLSFGLCNSPAFFQRMIQLILSGLTWKICLAYLDDVIVLGKDFEDHLNNLVTVLERFRQYNLKLKPQKCRLFQNEVLFLGKLVNEKGVSVNPDSKNVILKWPIPTKRRDVESFLGFANYHRDHIQAYAKLAEPLYALTKKKAPFCWKEEQQTVFQAIQEALVNSATLAYPHPDAQFILDTDASDTTIGAELSQIIEGKEFVISYASRVLTPAQRRYCTTRKELLAIIVFTRQFRSYLLGRQFTVRTDHSSLTWLLRFKMIEGQLARWLEELSQYDLIIQHRAGNKHSNADGLSRRPDTLTPCNCYLAGADIASLPCGGCNYCARAQRTWGTFEEDVDNVIPLAVRSIQQQSDKLEENINFSNWVGEKSTTEIAAEQDKDSDLSRLNFWLKNNIVPEEHEIYLCSQAVKYWWNCKTQLVLKENVLCYKWLDPVEPRLLIIVPKSLRQVVLSNCHDSKSSGHFGQSKTLYKVKQRFIWYGMTEETRNYVKTCRTCNINKKANVAAKGALGQYHAGSPMEKIHMDILGPLHESRLGNKYILVLIDQFTKWIEVFPLPDQTATTIAKTVVEGFTSRLGCPIQIHTDQGKNFDGKLFHSLCNLLEIVKSRTTPYRPSSNGQVERYNSLILQMIRCHLKGNQRDWDLNLQQLAGAIRSTENRQTGYTPNMMMLGREVIQPVDLLTGTCKLNFKVTEPSPYITDLKNTLEEVHTLARDKLQGAQFRQKKAYDIKLYQKTYNIGDIVYHIDSATRIGQSKKLRSPWKGPYLIIKVLSPVLYRIRQRKKEMVSHHDKLKPCEDRNIPFWIKRLRNKLLHGEIETNADTSLEEEETDMGDDLASLFSEVHSTADKFIAERDSGAVLLDEPSSQIVPDPAADRDNGVALCSQDPTTRSGQLPVITNMSDIENIDEDLDDTLPYSVEEDKIPRISNLASLQDFGDWDETFLYDLNEDSVADTDRGQRRRGRPKHLDDYVMDDD